MELEALVTFSNFFFCINQMYSKWMKVSEWKMQSTKTHAKDIAMNYTNPIIIEINTQ